MKALTLVEISSGDELLIEVAKLTKENKKYMAELARYMKRNCSLRQGLQATANIGSRA